MFRTLIYSLIFALTLSASAMAETQYSAVISDLPLMTGMAEQPEQAVVFDKPGGRIIETTAITALPAEDVRKFYAEALPPLGWKTAGADAFARNGEILVIVFADKAVQFKITPQD
jgi:hypothetical protein